jgi:hypothetical protein
MTVGNETTNNKTAPPADKTAAAKKLAEQYGLNDPNPPPPAPPSMGDKLLAKAGIDSKLRNASKSGRKSSFLTGAMGDVTDPIVSDKKALGKY